MAGTGNQQKNLVHDSLGPLDGGMNNGVVPLLIPKNTSSFLINATVEGGFLGPRPPVKRFTIDYGGSTTLQASVEGGLFQGSGFYQPDVGLPSVIAQISGRLFLFTVTGSATATCAEITIPNDPNPATIPLVWMWQAEKWMIITDGQSIPIYYDGVSARRSFSNSITLGQVSVDFTAPAKQSTVQITLIAPYTGQLNIPIFIDGVLYQTTSQPSGYSVIITNVTDNQTYGSISNPATVLSQPAAYGYVTVTAPIVNNAYGKIITLVLSAPFTGVSGTFGPFNTITGDTVTVNDGFFNKTVTGKVASVSGDLKTIELQIDIFNLAAGVTTVHQGQAVFSTTNNQPNFPIGKTQATILGLAAGVSTTVLLDTAYSGPNGQLVFIGSLTFSIALPPGSGSTNVINVINLGDTATTIHGPSQPTRPGILTSVPELPPCRMGVYGLGRNWVSLLDGRRYIGGDIVNGSSGTPAYNGRDAVLRVTENALLFGGGSFCVPGNIGDIRAMIFTATLDTSLGQGPLQIFTTQRVFSVNAPVDRTDWAAITNPIQTESFVGGGATAQDSTINVNGDIVFRSLDGIRSLILARRDFDTWGNVPQSNEVRDILALDDPQLLPYGSAINFSNRWLMTCLPSQGPQGVFNQGTVVVNYDPISSLRGKAPAVYDGFWSALNILKLVAGTVNGTNRAFAFTYSTSRLKIELFEWLRGDGDRNFDNDSEPITFSTESAILFRPDDLKSAPYLRLENGEVYISDIAGVVTFETWWRPDYDQCWHPWHTWSICANNFTSGPLQYRPPMGLGQPPKTCDPVTNKQFTDGYFFQFRIRITGQATFMGGKFEASKQPDPQYAPVICDPIC